MRARALLLLSLLFLALAAPLPTAVGREVEEVKLVSEAWLRGTVIVLYGAQYGTGFWINPTHIATAAHVVNFDPTAVVTVIRGAVRSTGRVVALDRQSDIAIIYVHNSELFDKHVFPIARSMPDVGSTIYVIGYPHELLQIVGSLEALSEHPRVLTSRLTWVANGLLELGGITDAGNSGGPVLNAVGEVIGIVSFALRGRAGTLYFATSAGSLKRLCEEHNIAYVEGVAGTVLQPIADNPVAAAVVAAVVTNIVMDVVLVLLGVSIGMILVGKLRKRWRR